MWTRLLLVLGLTVCVFAGIGQTRVRGHFRKDGTYVMPHYRSRADSSFWNNWSTSGNLNPYTGKYGTRTSPPASYGSSGINRSTSQPSTYSPSSYQSAQYELDLELIKAQNELRITRERLQRELEALQSLERERRRLEAEREIQRLAEQRDRLQSAYGSSGLDFGAASREAPTNATPVTNAPKRTTHTLYIVKRDYEVEFSKPLTLAEALECQDDILAELFPDHYKQYFRHKLASERALDRRDYDGFTRCFSRAKGIIEGKEWAYIKPSVKFKTIRDARTLILNTATEYARLGWMTRDAALRSSADSHSRSYRTVYDGEVLCFVPGPHKDWLGVRLVNGKLGYVRTSDCQVSQYIWTRR